MFTAKKRARLCLDRKGVRVHGCREAGRACDRSAWCVRLLLEPNWKRDSRVIKNTDWLLLSRIRVSWLIFFWKGVMWIFMPPKPQSERTTLIWSRLNPGPRSALAYQSVRPRREKLSIREREVKQRLLVVMVAAAELRAKYGAPLTESDSEGIPASIREKNPST